MRNRLSSLTPVAAAFLSVIVIGPAHSQPSDAMKACLGRGGVALDQRIAACSSVIEAGTETNENLALAYGNRGHARVFKREVEAARKDFEESIRRDPSSASAHRFRGNLSMLDTDERKASEAYRKAIEIDPKLGPAYAALGALAARRGAASAAIELLNKAIEFEPDDLLAHLMRGHARIQTEAYDQAIADFTAALKGPPPPERAEALFGRGSAFAHKGEHQKALTDYDEGLRLKADRGEAFAIRCVIRAALGQAFDAVMADCDKALTLPGIAVAVRNFRGYAFLKLDRPDRAMTEFNAALQELSTRRPGPGGPLLSEIQALVLIGRGLAKRRLGDTQDGVKDLELAAKLSSRTRQRAAVFFNVKE